jgi:DNA topoisomerase-1
MQIPYKKMIAKVSIKGSKQHYTEARLVQLLEERGIGRPSTFSSLVDKIQERGYVKKEDIKGKEITCKDFELENGEICEIESKREFGNEKGKLVIQPLGIIVIEFLEKHFHDLFNYQYTSKMEEVLDQIANGRGKLLDVCSECNQQVENLLNVLTEEKGETKIEYKIDENHTYIIGKYGPVLKCITPGIEKGDVAQIFFKPVIKDIDIGRLERGEYKLEDLIDSDKQIQKNQYHLGKWEGKDVIIKKGKFGLYAVWGDTNKSLKEFGNRPLENITLDEVSPFLTMESSIVREVSKNITIRKGKKGDYIFFKTPKMKKPNFFPIEGCKDDLDELIYYKTCKLDVLKSWIQEKYNIE